MSEIKANIKKSLKRLLPLFLIFQMAFLNSFSTFISGNKCCHTKVAGKCSHIKEQLKEKTGCCHSMQKQEEAKSCCSALNEKSESNTCSKNQTGTKKIHKQCNCFHSAGSTDNYVVEGQYKIVFPLFGTLEYPSSSDICYSSSFFSKQQNTIQTNSPPFYISTSQLII